MEELKVGLTRPIRLGSWWEIQDCPVEVHFRASGWSSNGGIHGELYIGPRSQVHPISVSFSDTSFVNQVNDGRIVESSEEREATPNDPFPPRQGATG